ncbi:MAG TPA: hypothetical protein VF039_13720 [Longimicrobiales bacterium]
MENIFRMCPPNQDPVLSLLRLHLLTEYYLERLLANVLPRADRLTEKGRLSYAQKVSLVHALDVIDDRTIASLRGLNAVRNACAHEMDRAITLADIDRFGRPLGADYTAIRRQYHDDLEDLLRLTAGTACKELVLTILQKERQAATKIEQSKQQELLAPSNESSVEL